MVRVDVARSVASRLRGPDVQVFEELLHDGRRGAAVAAGGGEPGRLSRSLRATTCSGVFHVRIAR